MPTRLWSFLVLAPQGLERVRQRGVRGGAGRAEGFGFAEGFFSHGGAPVSFSFPETFGFGKRRVSADAERNRSPRRRRERRRQPPPARRGEAQRRGDARGDHRGCGRVPPHQSLLLLIGDRGDRPALGLSGTARNVRLFRLRPERTGEEAREQRDERGGFARVPRRRAGDERAHVARQRGEPRAGFVVAVVAVVAEKGAPVVARRRRHGQQSPRAPQRRRAPARSGFRKGAFPRLALGEARDARLGGARRSGCQRHGVRRKLGFKKTAGKRALHRVRDVRARGREPGVARGGARGVVPRAGGTPRYPAVPGQAVRY